MKSFKPWRDFFKEWYRSRNDPNIVISFPKSGRTWHRASVGIYVATAYGLDLSKSLDTHLIMLAAGLPTTSYCHNGANFLHSSDPNHFLNANSSLWHRKNNLLLVRDPRAILVSGFHHMKWRSKRFDGTLSEYIRHPHMGIEKILVAYCRWHENSKKSKKFMVQSYEGMHANRRVALCNALEFLGVTKINEDALEQTLMLTTFDNLKKLEQEGYFQHNSMQSGKADANGQKVREGKIDGFKTYLSLDDLEFIQQAIDRIGNPFEEVIRRGGIGDQTLSLLDSSRDEDTLVFNSSNVPKFS